VGWFFSAALARHPAQFNPPYCQRVEVGDAAGALPAVLARVADDRERGAAPRVAFRPSSFSPLPSRGSPTHRTPC